MLASDIHLLVKRTHCFLPECVKNLTGIGKWIIFPLHSCSVASESSPQIRLIRTSYCSHDGSSADFPRLMGAEQLESSVVGSVLRLLFTVHWGSAELQLLVCCVCRPMSNSDFNEKNFQESGD